MRGRLGIGVRKSGREGATIPVGPDKSRNSTRATEGNQEGVGKSRRRQEKLYEGGRNKSGKEEQRRGWSGTAGEGEAGLRMKGAGRNRLE